MFEELRGLVLKTSGLADVLLAALAPLADGIRAAFVFGSVARETETSSSDVDLMVISDRYGYADLFAALERASSTLGRRVNPRVQTPAELARRVAEGHAFTMNVLAQPKLWILGGLDDLAA